MGVICLLTDIWDRGPPGSLLLPFYLLLPCSLLPHTSGSQCAEHSTAVLLRVRSIDAAAITALGNKASMVSRLWASTARDSFPFPEQCGAKEWHPTSVYILGTSKNPLLSHRSHGLH